VAEKTFLQLRDLSNQTSQASFIAVSHSSSAATESWLSAIGGAGNVTVVVDPERELYAQWGLGSSGFYHVLSPSSLFAIGKLGWEEGLWNRPTESGTRWQKGGSFAVDSEGVVRWIHVANMASDVSNFNAALESVGASN
jgi:hypothetical protein